MASNAPARADVASTRRTTEKQSAGPPASLDVAPNTMRPRLEAGITRPRVSPAKVLLIVAVIADMLVTPLNDGYTSQYRHWAGRVNRFRGSGVSKNLRAS